MAATLKILDAAGAKLAYDTIEIGEAVYLRGQTSGIDQSSWDILRRNKIFLKAPITTPQGGGYKSLNVTVRKTLGLYANVRPCASYDPVVATAHPDMDIVIVRENEEDLYAGIEHRQTQDAYQCLKLITRMGCEKIVRYAFEYARSHGRRKVTCLSKDNIMKLTDGLFHKVYDEIGAEYPEIEKEHLIIDIGIARVAKRPTDFDVIVTLNLYGDILSDVVAEIAGSVGLAPSANIGEKCAMFEAIHGSAPLIAGKGIANPSGLLLAAVMMLSHLGQGECAAKIHNAWLKTMEDGIHTGDIYVPGMSKEKVGTDGFADAVIARLGQVPSILPKAKVAAEVPMNLDFSHLKDRPKEEKTLVGVDIFVHFDGDPNELGDRVTALGNEDVSLVMITNRGVKVYPGGVPETGTSDHFRCRFMKSDSLANLPHGHIVDLLKKFDAAGLDFTKTENLCLFNGLPGFSLGQGQ
jgi:isocitrate dehydrogenase